MDIQRTYSLSFPVEVVFAAWISNDYRVPPVIAIEVNPIEGGVFRLRTSDAVMDGEILQIEPNRILRYSWHWGGPATPSIVEVNFSKSNRTTRVDVSHSGLDSPSSVAAHETGWDSYIDGLTRLLGQ